MKRYLFLILLTAITLISLNFVSAAHLVNSSDGGVSFNVREDITNLFNISINNTDTGQNANITQVNITLWGNFIFAAGTSGTDASDVLFTNTSTILIWTKNATFVINGSEKKYFWFNATASTPGTYNITVTTLNGTADSTSNLSITVNDTTPPSSISITFPQNATSYNYNVSAINYTVSELGGSCWYSNSSGAWNSTTANAGTNFTNVLTTEGSNSFKVYCNDTAGNLNVSNAVVFTKDTIAPSYIDFASPTPANGTIKISPIPINVSAADSGTINRITIRIYNSTSGLIGAPLVQTGTATSFSTEISDLEIPNNQDTIYINATVNDTAGNINNSATRVFIYTNTSFQFNGTVKDENGLNLNNSNVSVLIKNMETWSDIGTFSTTTNASGWFSIALPLNGDSQQTRMSWIYSPSFNHKNTTSPYNFVNFKSKSIPPFPYIMIRQLSGTIFYLTPAGTINITAVNSSGDRISFRYQVKDTKLGYPIADNFNSAVNEAVVYVPRNRNYSIMIYPDQSMPVSFEWNNFSSNSSYNFGTNSISSYNHTTYTLKKIFNTTLSLVRVSGYVNVSLLNWTNFTIIPYLLEPGNMVHSQYGAMPYNLSGFNQPPSSDIHNYTSGLFNISLPATIESSTIMLFATGVANDSNYYGGFRNISLVFGSSPSETTQFNFSKVFKLFGNSGVISMEGPMGGYINRSTAKTRFYLINSTNSTIGNTSAHVEVTVDYSSLSAIEFTWMVDVAQSSAISFFEIPLLNITGIKEMNIFVSGGSGSGNDQYAPKRTSFTAIQIAANNNVTIRAFNPGGIDSQIASGNIFVGLYISNSTCDVPNPPSACVLGNSEMMNMNQSDANAFNPMQAVMGGGKISFRMGVGNISVHYVNVDMIASGPPDAMFDSATTNTTSANSFDAAVRFGSTGPTIYDYVLVSMPYIDGNASISGLNDSRDVNMTLANIYDDNWNIIWNVSQNGTNASILAGNYSHYSTFQSQWNTLLGNNNCTKTATQLNSTNPCYIDTTNNKVWIRLPHFSGTGPKITGASVIAATSSNTSTSTSTGGGGSGTSTSFWINTQTLTDKQFTDGFTKEFFKKYRVLVYINKTAHSIGVVDLTSTTATINVSSKSQQSVFAIGDEKKFDVNEDDYYDLSVKLNSINSSKASITIKKVYEKIGTPSTSPTPETTPTTTPAASPTPTQTETVSVTPTESKSKLENIVLWILISIPVIIVIIIVIFLLSTRKEKKNFRKSIKIAEF